jgi:Tfp pilus assembly protein PilP
VKPCILICVLAGLAVVAGCGESKQEKAQKQVCSARADVQKQVAQLQSLTATSATTNGVKDNLNAIKGDLNKIADAQSQLGSDRKSQVQAANDKFVSEFRSIVGDLGTSLSVSGAKSNLQAATEQLASAYQSAFAKVDCST